MPNYISKEKLESLKQELGELKTTKRADIADRLNRAKELGDLSENAEYSEARDEQAKLEARIMELEDFVKNAKIIEKGGVSGEVKVGSTIVAEMKRNKKEYTYTIVGSREADPVNGMVSNESPFGSAFLGKKVSDEVIVETPNGKVTYTIIDIK